MKVNPVYKRETTVSSRSFRLALIVLVFNGILAAVALLNLYSVIAQVKVNAEIQYSSFLDLYKFVSAIEFTLLMFIMPAITSGSISGERERQTLDLMLTTKMTPAEIILGKLGASFSTMFLLILSSFPVLALVFVYGGVTIGDLLMLVVCYITVALFAGSLGICFSAMLKKSTAATVLSYGLLICLVAGTYAVNQFALALAKMNVDSYAITIGSVTKQANSGAFLYLLLLNPAVTFYVTVNGQVGNNQIINNISQWFGTHQANVVTDHWVWISIGVQLIFVGLFIMLAVHAISPKRKKTRKHVGMSTGN